MFNCVLNVYLPIFVGSLFGALFGAATLFVTTLTLFSSARLFIHYTHITCQEATHYLLDGPVSLAFDNA